VEKFALKFVWLRKYGEVRGASPEKAEFRG
jgi:hypothetical protein